MCIKYMLSLISVFFSSFFYILSYGNDASLSHLQDTFLYKTNYRYTCSCDTTLLSETKCKKEISKLVSLAPQLLQIEQKDFRGIYITPLNYTNNSLDEYGYLPLNPDLTNNNIINTVNNFSEYQPSAEFQYNLLLTKKETLTKNVYNISNIKPNCYLEDVQQCLPILENIKNIITKRKLKAKQYTPILISDEIKTINEIYVNNFGEYTIPSVIENDKLLTFLTKIIH